MDRRQFFGVIALFAAGAAAKRFDWLVPIDDDLIPEQLIAPTQWNAASPGWMELYEYSVMNDSRDIGQFEIGRGDQLIHRQSIGPYGMLRWVAHPSARIVVPIAGLRRIAAPSLSTEIIFRDLGTGVVKAMHNNMSPVALML